MGRVLLCFGVWAFAATASAETAPIPAWVVPIEPASTAEKDDGVETRLADLQIRVVGGERTQFQRWVFVGDSDAQAQAAAELAIPLEPGERLTLHRVNVAGRAQLATTPVRLAEVDGQVVAAFAIADVKGGELVELAFSKRRAAQAVDERIALRDAVPAGLGHVRFTTDRDVDTLAVGGALPPNVERRGKLTSFEWRSEQRPAGVVEPDAPVDFVPIPTFLIADRWSWSDVDRSMVAKFAERQPSAELLAAVPSIMAEETTPERRILAALRRVQDAALDVDAAPTLVAMLVQMDLPASIAMAADGRALSQELPSTAFDHALVVTQLGGERIWLDPSRSHQRGTLADVHPHEIHDALILDGAPDKQPIRVIAPSSTPPLEVAMLSTYRVRGWGDVVELTTKTTYRRAAANFLRANLANGGRPTSSEREQASIRASYPSATLVGEMKVDDDELANEITLVHEYRFDDWPEHNLVLGPFDLNEEELPVVEEGRASPLALTPMRLRNEFIVEALLPFAPSNQRVDRGGPGFTYQMILGGRGTTIHGEWELEIKADRVLPEDFAAYTKAREQVLDDQGFYVGEPPPEPERVPRTVSILAAIMSVLCWLGLAILVARKPFLPSNVRYDSELAFPWGGVLVLAERMLLGGALLVHAAFFLRKADASFWQPLVGDPVALAFVGVGIVFAWLQLGAVYLFFNAHRSFPLVTLVVLALGVIGAGMASFLGWIEAWVLPVVAVDAGLWAAYVLRSVRVRSTFLPPPQED